MSKDGYNTNTLHGDARPENIAIGRVDKAGRVVRLELIAESDPRVFMAFMQKCRTTLDPMDVVMPAPLWPVDQDGRGWTMLEVEQMQKAQQEKAA